MPRPTKLCLPAPGFTLIELMVTLAVAAVLMTIAAPSFVRVVADNRAATQTNELVGSLQLARSEAVRRNKLVSVSADSGTADFGANGWRSLTDANHNGEAASPATADDGTVLRVLAPVPTNTSVVRVTRTGSGSSATYATSTDTDKRYVTFNERGANVSATAAFFRVCDSSNAPARGRIVQISTVGKISLETSTAACP